MSNPVVVVAYALLGVACAILLGFAFGFVSMTSLNASMAIIPVIGATVLAHLAPSPKKKEGDISNDETQP